MSAKTKPGSTGERRFATGSEVLMLDELDELVKLRDLQTGLIGNLRGKVNQAQADLAAAEAKEAELEAKASRKRKAFEIARGNCICAVGQPNPFCPRGEDEDHYGRKPRETD